MRPEVKLRRSHTHTLYEFEEVLRVIANENANFLDMRWELAHNVACGFRRDVSRALVIEHKSQRICARVDRRERVLEIRDPANLYPSHGTQLFGLQLPVLLRLIF